MKEDGFMKNKRDSEDGWRRLDNTANVFPVIANKNYSSVFRISVRLIHEVSEEILQEALVETLQWFPSFNVKLKKGVFWHYFENNKKSPVVEKEQTYPCAYIDPNTNNQFLFKVTYFRTRINLEVFHAITDGTGALNFLKALIYSYIKLMHKDRLTKEVLEMPIVDVVSDVEDSYHKNYKKFSYKRVKSKSAYKIKGESLPISTMRVIHGEVSARAMIELCRQKKVSLTQYISTLIVWCIYREYLNEQPNSKPIQVNIPVNLRQFFNSTTEMNFFSYINIGINISKNEYTFEEILESTSEQFSNQLTKENLSQTISDNVATERNIFVRVAPLPVKNVGVRIAYMGSGKANTFVLSNVGRIDVIEEFKEYIDKFEVLLSVSKAEPIKCGVCSYEDKLVFSFTTMLREAYLQRAFFRHLSQQGIDVIIESNGIDYEKV